MKVRTDGSLEALSEKNDRDRGGERVELELQI